MAYVNTQRRGGSDTVGRLAAFFGALRTGIAQYNTYRRTLNELNALNDRELNDLGLNRSTIRSRAYEAAYGK